MSLKQITDKAPREDGEPLSLEFLTERPGGGDIVMIYHRGKVSRERFAQAVLAQYWWRIEPGYVCTHTVRWLGGKAGFVNSKPGRGAFVVTSYNVKVHGLEEWEGMGEIRDEVRKAKARADR